MAAWLYTLTLDELVSSNLLSWINSLQKIQEKERPIDSMQPITDCGVKIKSTKIPGLSFDKSKVIESTKFIDSCQIIFLPVNE